MTSVVATPTSLTYRRLRVRAARPITPHLVRVTFDGADLRDFTSVAPDQYVKVFFPGPGQARPQLPPPVTGDDVLSWYRTYLALPDAVRPPMRTYTVRAHRQGEIDVDFVLHPDSGPGSSWAATAAPGDEVACIGPHGLYDVPDGSAWQLLVGDESAIPAMAAILEELPSGARARVFVEVANAEHELPLPSAAEVVVRWVHRDGRRPGEAVLAELKAADLPTDRPYAWLSGEAGMVKHLRRHLVRERGIDKRAVTFTGYWRVGRSEEDIGRESLVSVPGR